MKNLKGAQAIDTWRRSSLADLEMFESIPWNTNPLNYMQAVFLKSEEYIFLIPCRMENFELDFGDSLQTQALPGSKINKKLVKKIIFCIFFKYQNFEEENAFLSICFVKYVFYTKSDSTQCALWYGRWVDLFREDRQPTPGKNRFHNPLQLNRKRKTSTKHHHRSSHFERIIKTFKKEVFPWPLNHCVILALKSLLIKIVWEKNCPDQT